MILYLEQGVLEIPDYFSQGFFLSNLYLLIQ
jgi:hypothetical protein